MLLIETERKSSEEKTYEFLLSAFVVIARQAIGGACTETHTANDI